MTNFRLLDSPLNNPDDDLFGISDYASKLAEFIYETQPPFTIGIYGEWGSGKTSFVGFLEYYLKVNKKVGEPDIKFIKFTAWPYRTSDELWRALILKIAQELYEINTVKQELPSTPTPVDSSILSWLASVLTSDALVLRSEVTEPNPVDEYRDLVSKLDSTLANGIGKSVGQQAQLNQEATLIALVKVATAALGSISPLISGLRGLLGLDTQVDLTNLLQREKNESARERIESTQEFQQIFHELFKNKANDKKVFVFLDDLDRCTPDVALDLLEAIKVFLGEVPCIFIVAADEYLIGQGLRLRFKDLLDGINQEQIQTFFTKKGKEYFEKIIQMGIRVPDRTIAQTHKFIAAQYPEWMPATDIIQTALGNNPRKIKQYCNLLKYKYLVAKHQNKDLSDRYELLRKKIVSIYSWSPISVKLLREIACKHPNYSQALANLEECCRESEDDKPVEKAEEKLLGEECTSLFYQVVASDPLLKLFQSEPFFTGFDSQVVAILTKLADAIPHSETILKTEDTVFSRLLNLGNQGTLDLGEQGADLADRILRDDSGRFISFYMSNEVAAAYLWEIARSDQWIPQTKALEAAIERPDDEKAITLLGIPAKQIFDNYVYYVQEDLADAEKLRSSLLKAPQFSSILPELIMAVWKIREKLPTADHLLSKTLNPNPSDIEKGLVIAEKAIDLLSPEDRKIIDINLNIRIQSAKHFLDLRKFTKLDTLVHCWPDLASLLNTNRSELIALEKWLVHPQPIEAQENPWQRYQQDEQLIKFLRLRPLLRDIFPHEVEGYLEASKGLTQTVQDSELVTATTVQPVDLWSKQTFHTTTYEDILLTLKELSENEYEVKLQAGKINTLEKISLTLQEIREIIARLNRLVSYRPSVGQSTRKLIVVEADEDVPSGLRAIGTQIFEWVFTGSVREQFLKLITSEKNFRLIWEIDNNVSQLPLESLYIPAPLRSHLALTRKYSLIRRIPTAHISGVSELTPPLRILVMLSNPKDTAPLNITGEERILRRLLDPEAQNRQVQLEILRDGDATWAALQKILRKFRPHIFHFVGHGVYDVTRDEGALIFEDSNRLGIPISARQFATLLSDAQIKLAVLNACDTGIAAQNDAITGVAGALISAGLPAAVATMRGLPDEVALMFTQEFYRAFLDGYNVEESIVEARKALSIENWDWSIYTLFNGSTALDELKLSNQFRFIG